MEKYRGCLIKKNVGWVNDEPMHNPVFLESFDGRELPSEDHVFARLRYLIFLIQKFVLVGIAYLEDDFWIIKDTKECVIKFTTSWSVSSIRLARG